MAVITPVPICHSELRAKIANKTARIGIIGLGYVGLPLTLLFNDARFPVTGFDIDPKKVRILSEGGSYIFRIAAADIKVANSRGFRATNDYSQIEQMDAIIICVPTPLDDHREPDMSYIVSTSRALRHTFGLAS